MLTTRLKMLPILFILCCLLSYGQHSEPVQLKVVYQVSYNNKAGLNIINDSCLLQISKTYSTFFSLGNITFSEKMKADFEKNGYNHTPGEPIQIKTCNTCYKNVYYKKYTNNTTYRVASLMSKKYAYPINQKIGISWQISTDTAIIAGYKCFKAIGTIDTTKYVAWFTIDIPINDGPAFLNGLPGLILEASTNNGISIKTNYLQYLTSTTYLNTVGYNFEITTYENFIKAENYLKQQFQKGNPINMENGATIQRKLDH